MLQLQANAPGRIILTKHIDKERGSEVDWNNKDCFTTDLRKICDAKEGGKIIDANLSMKKPNLLYSHITWHGKCHIQGHHELIVKRVFMNIVRLNMGTTW